MTRPRVQYNVRNSRLYRGVQCELCGLAPDPPDGRYLTVDHCHAHGWLRGTLCRSCNGLMMLIDALVRPKSERVSMRALLRYKRRCEDCVPFTVKNLTRPLELHYAECLRLYKPRLRIAASPGGKPVWRESMFDQR